MAHPCPTSPVALSEEFQGALLINKSFSIPHCLAQHDRRIHSPSMGEILRSLIPLLCLQLLHPALLLTLLGGISVGSRAILQFLCDPHWALLHFDFLFSSHWLLRSCKQPDDSRS